MEYPAIPFTKHYPILYVKMGLKMMVVHRLYPESDTIQVRAPYSDEAWTHSISCNHSILEDGKFKSVATDFLMYHRELECFVKLKDVRPFGKNETLYYYTYSDGVSRAATFAKFENTRDDTEI